MVQNNLNLLTFSVFFVLSDLCTNPFFLYSCLFFFFWRMHTYIRMYGRKVMILQQYFLLYSIIFWISSLLFLHNLRHCFTFLQHSLWLNVNLQVVDLKSSSIIISTVEMPSVFFWSLVNTLMERANTQFYECSQHLPLMLALIYGCETHKYDSTWTQQWHVY